MLARVTILERTLQVLVHELDAAVMRSVAALRAQVYRCDAPVYADVGAGSMNPASAQDVVILMGLQGAGKTTFYRARFADTHAHVSMDLWPNAPRRGVRVQRVLDEALAAGRSVVIDNTHPRRDDRKPLITLARARGARVIGYFFDVSTRAAIARNRQREGRAQVPPVAIFTTAKRLEPPTREEGFDELYRVTLDETHGPVVAPM